MTAEVYEHRYEPSLEAEVVRALGVAGTRAAHLSSGEHRVLPPAELYPLGSTASAGHSVRQRLSAVIWPPEGGLLGVVCAEVRDVIRGERHVGALVTRLATEGQPHAQLLTTLEPGRLLTAYPEPEDGAEPEWQTAITLDPKTDNPTILHRGEQGTDVFAAPTNRHEPLLLLDASLWAPEPQAVWDAFTGHNA
jgi:hypothetical protein